MDKNISDLKAHWKLIEQNRREQLEEYCKSFIILNDDVCDVSKMKDMLMYDDIDYQALEKELDNCFNNFK